MMLGGRLVDVIGIRISLSIALVAAGLLAIVMAGMPVYWMMLVVGVVLGIVHGPANPAVTKAVAQWFPARSRGTAMSIKQSGFPLAGMVMAALLPSMAMGAGSWRPVLVGVGVVVIVVGVFSFIVYREHPGDALMKARSISFRETGRQLISRNMLALGSMAGCLTGVQMATLTYLVLYLKEFQGMTVVEAGGMLSIAYFGGAAGRVGWGVLSDRFFGGSRRRVLILVGIISVLTMAVTAFIGPGQSTPVLILLSAMMGATAMGWNGVYFAFIVELAGATSAATAVGFSMTFQQVGNLITPPLFGYLVDVTQDYRVAWLLCVVLIAVGLACAMVIQEPKKQIA
jgi:sugar phosphate permease